MRELTRYEQETIINFNKDENIAHIFTYEGTWQRHLENKLGLQPFNDNGSGGKEYEVPKSRIRPPRAPKQLSEETRQKLAERLRQHNVSTAKAPIVVANGGKKGNTVGNGTKAGFDTPQNKVDLLKGYSATKVPNLAKVEL